MDGTSPEVTPVPLCQKQKARPHSRKRGEAENLRHPEHTLAALTEKSNFRNCRQRAIMRGIPAHENALVKRITVRPPKPTDPPGEGERQQGQNKKKGQDPLLRWREGDTESSPEVKTTECGAPPQLQSRPAGPRMTQTHPEEGPEKRSQEPNCSNSFTRDQIGRI